MKIDYKNNAYNIYLNNSRKNPLNEFHIHGDNVVFIKELFIEMLGNCLCKHFIIKQFDKAMIECIKKQLESVN